MKTESQKGRLSKTHGGGWIALLGLMFFLLGIAVLISPIYNPLGIIDNGVGVIGGLVFTVLGAANAFIRHGWRIDGQSRTIAFGKGVLVTPTQHQRKWSEFTEVRISRAVRGSAKHKYVVYPVKLIASRNESFELDAPRGHFAARALAEQVAKLMELDLRDDVGERITVRDAGFLDESLAQRYRRTGQSLAAPDPPTELTPEGSLVLLIPAGALSAMDILAQLVMVVASAFLFIFIATMLAKDLLVRATGSQVPWFSSVAWALFLAFWLRRLVLWYHDRGVGSCLTVGPEGLRLKRGWQNRFIPADQLEEVELSGDFDRTLGLTGDGRLEARSDKMVLGLGYGNTGERMQWVRDTIHHFYSSSSV